MAKAALDLGVEGERLEGELRSLKSHLAAVEEAGEEGDLGGSHDGSGVNRGGNGTGGNGGEDENVLKIKVFRSLGIDAQMDAETGEFTRAVVRSAARGDVNVVTIDPNFDRFFYANHFWGSL